MFAVAKWKNKHKGRQKELLEKGRQVNPAYKDTAVDAC